MRKLRIPSRTFAALIFSAALGFAVPALAQQYQFETIAGDFDGDGGHAMQANLGAPTGIAFDRNGGLFVAEAYRHRIRKIGLDGTISTVAGTGVPGYTDQPAHAPGDTSHLGRIDQPQNLAIDQLGNLYFSDTNNHRVRRLGIDGKITLVAGNGKAESSGDGGRAISGGLNQPYGLALDAFGNLFIAENFGHRVRKVTPQGIISTVAGNGVAAYGGDGGPATQASLNQPMGIAIDAQNNLYIADHLNQRVRKVTPAGVMSTFAQIESPTDAVFDGSGNLYVSRFCAITKITSAGSQQAFLEDPNCASLSFPERLAFREGTAYFADSDQWGVYRKGPQDAWPVRIVGRGSFFGDGGPAVAASLSGVQGIAVDQEGTVYLADSLTNDRIRKISPNGQIATIAGSGQFSSEDANNIPALQAQLGYPNDVEIDALGRIYIVDSLNRRVRRIDADGKLRNFAGNGIYGYSGDGGAGNAASMRRPSRMAIDSAGNVYIADISDHRIRKVNTAGIISTVAGNGAAGYSGDGGAAVNASLSSPSAVAVDTAGNLYIADQGNRRVRKVAVNGVITTVAGNGQSGASGDGGAATNAAIGSPSGLAVAANGDLYIAAGALRRVSPSGRITTEIGLEHPARDVAIGRDGAIYVASIGGRALKGVPATGGALSRQR